MRLFIALPLTDPVLPALAELTQKLKADGIRGNFTRPENLHLTLHFLGECEPGDVGTLGDILSAARGGEFPLTCGHIGTFERSGILWAGVNRSPELLELYDRLGKALRQAGFPVETRPYRPHLTLVREYMLPDGYTLPQLPPVIQIAREVRLMESVRENGRLVYRTVRGVPLQQ
ncbi:MAG: RNA 2',3'-cyclic phosphodiesterase [Eubacteriales bacterium]|jgi:2'-5' RNA ligase